MGKMVMVMSWILNFFCLSEAFTFSIVNSEINTPEIIYELNSLEINELS